jgi:hypothetical protein
MAPPWADLDPRYVTNDATTVRDAGRHAPRRALAERIAALPGVDRVRGILGSLLAA